MLIKKLLNVKKYFKKYINETINTCDSYNYKSYRF